MRFSADECHCVILAFLLSSVAPRDVEEVLLGASLQTNNQSMSGASDDPLLSLSAFALTPPAEKAHASWEGFCSSDEEGRLIIYECLKPNGCSFVLEGT